jgi:lipopolysaccharide transport system permease protein
VKTVITPQHHLLRLNLRELWQFRDLFYLLSLRDIKVRYKQTVIGVAWAFLQPVVTTLIFTVFFGNLAQIPSDDIPYPLFVYLGLLFWNFYSQALTNASASLVTNEQIVKKIYFPRLLMPAAAMFVSFIDFLIATLIFVGMMVYYQFVPTITGLWLFPLLALLTYGAALGLGLFLAALNVKYRDVRYAVPFLIQTLLFVTPVIYSTTIVSSQYQWMLYLNPMAGIIENARNTLLGSGVVNWFSLAIAAVVSMISLVVGLLYFRKTERYFSDLI